MQKRYVVIERPEPAAAVTILRLLLLALGRLAALLGFALLALGLLPLVATGKLDAGNAAYHLVA